MLLQKSNKKTYSQDRYYECCYTANNKCIEVTGTQNFRRFLIHIIEAFNCSCHHRRHSQVKRKFCCKRPAEFLLHTAYYGSGTSAQSWKNDGQYLVKTNDKSMFVGYFILFKNNWFIKPLINK